MIWFIACLFAGVGFIAWAAHDESGFWKVMFGVVGGSNLTCAVMLLGKLVLS